MKTWSVQYHPLALPADHTVNVMIETEDHTTPAKIVQDLSDVNAMVIWMVQVPNIHAEPNRLP